MHFNLLFKLFLVKSAASMHFIFNFDALHIHQKCTSFSTFMHLIYNFYARIENKLEYYLEKYFIK